MTPLRQRMLEDMQVRRLSPATVELAHAFDHPAPRMRLGRSRPA